MMALVLLVDDDPDLRAALRAFLESRHHRVIEASDGAQAFAMAEKERPHILVMDIVMCGVYGSSAVRKLREHPPTRHIPIVLMSGSAEKSVLGDVVREPGVRFLRKPFQPAELERLIEELLPEGGYTP